jgi:L,D-transpeptidase ErfK/SrfK
VITVPTLAAIAFAVLRSPAQAQGVAPRATRVVGREFLYEARSGESLALLGARFGVDPGRLARENGLTATARLSIGQSLKIDNRHVVPEAASEGIVLNVPQRLLFVFRDGALVAWYPAAVGRRDWQTPTDRFQVTAKRRDPSWHVPVSIQEEMRRLGRVVRSVVPPGPDNPLGRYWIGLSASLCGIHGTNAPSSIYGFRTHGCVRLRPQDVADLFGRTPIGTPVEVIYEPVLLAREADGAVYLEVNPDAYGRMGSLRGAFEALAARQGISGIDPVRADAVLAAREGVATRIDRSP